MADLTGKTAVVTGASRGIGAEVARALAKAGVNVVLAARSSGKIGRLAEEITANGGQAHAVTCDVADYTQITQVVETAEYAFGPVDILVNNAGVIEPIAMLADSDPAAWAMALDINVKGVYFGTRAVLPGMIGRGQGHIITIGSGAAHAPLDGWSHYCASKSAALMLTRSTDEEARADGVIAINLSPGTVATEMQVAIKASGINRVSALDPSAHIPADWPARAVVWLCGPDGHEFAGKEVSLRDPDIRRAVGLAG